MGQYESKVRKATKNVAKSKAARGCSGRCSNGCKTSCSFSYRVPLLGVTSTK
nr:hypothetical protein [uncultured Sellimonas sp.]